MPYKVTFYNNERKLRLFTRNRCVKNVNKGSQLKQSMYMFQNSLKCMQENYEEMGHQELGDTHRILLKIRPQLIG